MVLDTLGVINQKFFSLSNYTLTKQLLLINFFAAIIGLLIFFLINLYLINTDKSIDLKVNETKNNLQSISIYLENNSIARVPLFKNCRINNIIDESCSTDNFFDDIKLSNPELEPTSAQQYIIQNFLDSNVNIRIYNNSMIEIINSSTIFLGDKNTSAIKVLEISETGENSENLATNYLNSYLKIFNFFYAKQIRKIYTDDIVRKKHDIQIFKETNKKRRLISHKYIDQNDNIIHLSSAPIITNNKVYGIVILSLMIDEKNNDLGFTSFTLFNFYILFIFVTILLSLFFIRDLISPIKELSKITLLEREKIRNKKKLRYPKRQDEIGILSIEIQNMSNELKTQMHKLEKFTADVAHELKNPLTSIKNSSELLLNKNISNENKNIILKNFNSDVNRMNKLISDISDFSRIIAEIENEEFQLVNINSFLSEFKNNFYNYEKDLKIELNLDSDNRSVLVNKNKFLQVILNLIDNSISVVKKQSIILISSKIVKNKILKLKFYDQGPGIKIEDKNKIFERFYTDRDINKQYHSGLGLSISREIIKSFKGTIELTESDNMNFRGACFMIKLPLRDV